MRGAKATGRRGARGAWQRCAARLVGCSADTERNTWPRRWARATMPSSQSLQVRRLNTPALVSSSRPGASNAKAHDSTCPRKPGLTSLIRRCFCGARAPGRRHNQPTLTPRTLAAKHVAAAATTVRRGGQATCASPSQVWGDPAAGAARDAAYPRRCNNRLWLSRPQRRQSRP